MSLRKKKTIIIIDLNFVTLLTRYCECIKTNLYVKLPVGADFNSEHKSIFVRVFSACFGENKKLKKESITSREIFSPFVVIRPNVFAPFFKKLEDWL